MRLFQDLLVLIFSLLLLTVQDLLVLIFSLLLLPARIKAKIGAKRVARRIYRLGVSDTDDSFFNRYMDILKREIKKKSPKIECWYDYFKVVLAENRKSIDEWENFYDHILNLTIYSFASNT